jgi:hypothetical protein
VLHINPIGTGSARVKELKREIDANLNHRCKEFFTLLPNALFWFFEEGPIVSRIPGALSWAYFVNLNLIAWAM